MPRQLPESVHDLGGGTAFVVVDAEPRDVAGGEAACSSGLRIGGAEVASIPGRRPLERNSPTFREASGMRANAATNTAPSVRNPL
jgi:hypothetical protein